MKISTSARNGAANAIVDLLDVGTTNASGRLLIYQGTQPASPQAAPTGSTLLVTIPLANPAFGNASTGTAAIGAPVSATVTASGTAQWGRFVDRDGNAIFDVSIGTSGSDINFDNATFVSGGTAALSTFSVTQPQ